MKFKKFVENTDIFGFGKKEVMPSSEDNIEAIQPIKRFDVELMMEFLSHKSIGSYKPFSVFTNEIRWGHSPGAVRLEVDTGYTFFIKKLVTDIQGNTRWIAKKAFQLNRQGYGGHEDAIAQEIFEHIENEVGGNLDTAQSDFRELERLAYRMFGKIKQTCKDIFIPEGVKRLSDDVYVLTFGVKGQGVGVRGHQRVEQNQTMLTYDREQGTIRVTNYNILSPTGESHSWTINPNDLDLYFVPTQPFDEITECICVHFKYY